MRTAPVALFFYNRPDHLRRVFNAIAEHRPAELLLIADGPKDPNDARDCEEARAVVESIGWPCNVRRNYAETNLGLRTRVSSGLDWVFAEVSEAIILEDDCVPAAEFFVFCEQLLERYRDDARIMEIGGSNYQRGQRRSTASYYFSSYACVYGWATWRRAWEHYDVEITQWPRLRDSGLLESILGDARQVAFWRDRFDELYYRKASTWDFQWQLAIWSQRGLSAVPEANLVSNIGFGPGATHTTDAQAPEANIPLETLADLSHPAEIRPNVQADRFLFDTLVAPGQGGVAELVRRVRTRLFRWAAEPRRSI